MFYNHDMKRINDFDGRNIGSLDIVNQRDL